MSGLLSLRNLARVVVLFATAMISSPAWSQYDGLNYTYGGGYGGGYGVGGHYGGYGARQGYRGYRGYVGRSGYGRFDGLRDYSPYRNGYDASGYRYGYGDDGYQTFGNGYGVYLLGKGYGLYGNSYGYLPDDGIGYPRGNSRQDRGEPYAAQAPDLSQTFKPWYGFYPPKEGEHGEAPAKEHAAKDEAPAKDKSAHHLKLERSLRRKYVSGPQPATLIRRAELLFRVERYDSSVELASRALAEMPHNGKLMLLLSHALFASGDYEAAAGAIHKASSILDKDDWGYVVRNSRDYYRGRAYVRATDRLNQFIEEHPEAAYARFLRAYHFGFLGRDEFARKEMSKAIELESRDNLAVVLLEQFGGASVKAVANAVAEQPPAADAAVAKPAVKKPANDDSLASDQQRAEPSKPPATP